MISKAKENRSPEDVSSPAQTLSPLFLMITIVNNEPTHGDASHDPTTTHGTSSILTAAHQRWAGSFHPRIQRFRLP